MKHLVIIFLLALPAAGHAATCEELTAAYSKYDNATDLLGKKSRSETNVHRQQANQVALSNILRRQSMILDIMIAQSCPLPDPPDFAFLGLINSMN